MKLAAISLLLLNLLTSSNAFSNIPAVPGRQSGYSYGTGKTNIEIEAVYDLTCSDCKAYDPKFQAFLKSDWLDSTVGDQIKVTYTFFPLPYHHGCWFVHKLLPYFEDQCRTEGQTCNYIEYINFSLANQNDVLNARASLQEDMVNNWTKKVADQFKLKQQDLIDAVHSSENEDRLRTMWKYAASKGATGTPTYFVNSIMLLDPPYQTADWLKLLNDVYTSQWPKPETSKSS